MPGKNHGVCSLKGGKSKGKTCCKSCRHGGKCAGKCHKKKMGSSAGKTGKVSQSKRIAIHNHLSASGGGGGSRGPDFIPLQGPQVVLLPFQDRAPLNRGVNPRVPVLNNPPAFFNAQPAPIFGGQPNPLANPVQVIADRFYTPARNADFLDNLQDRRPVTRGPARVRVAKDESDIDEDYINIAQRDQRIKDRIQRRMDMQTQHGIRAIPPSLQGRPTLTRERPYQNNTPATDIYRGRGYASANADNEEHKDPDTFVFTRAGQPTNNRPNNNNNSHTPIAQPLFDVA